jgi:hypothetical protein
MQTTYQQVCRKLPNDAAISCTFGNPGVGGYSELYRTPDGRRFMLSNGSYLDYAPFTWSFTEI